MSVQNKAAYSNGATGGLTRRPGFNTYMICKPSRRRQLILPHRHATAKDSKSLTKPPHPKARGYRAERVYCFTVAFPAGICAAEFTHLSTSIAIEPKHGEARDISLCRKALCVYKSGSLDASPLGPPYPGATYLNTALSAIAKTDRFGPHDGDPFEQIATALRTDGYVVLPAPLPQGIPSGLLRHFKSINEEHFKRAGIGREEEHQLNRFVRGDQICWLDASSPPVNAYLEWMESLRLGLNRRLFLGLFDYECHYAHYDRGTFYKKHLDAFKGNTNRVVSTVLYLTPNWQPRDGGELAIYPPEVEGEPAAAEPLLKVAPRFGQMVIFLSEEFPHEVLTVNRPRYSVTGWFRVNNSLGDNIDPAK